MLCQWGMSVPHSRMVHSINRHLVVKCLWPKFRLERIFPNKREQNTNSHGFKHFRGALREIMIHWNGSGIMRYYCFKKRTRWFSCSNVLGISLSKCSKITCCVYQSSPIYSISCPLIFPFPIFLYLTMLYDTERRILSPPRQQWL